ncbi:hypothetical protein QVH35_03780 [Candidatus Nitrosotenuis chungbukensis]|uniref:hypothetical protein n=1 Tax=Candidatus Nitrosotenuis chungbukensis TaxID=1353246 RepID=UPI0005B27760|nr:hypothetical protein [Candidatus Nitrosotenuis chungbukensis]WKT58514.1 hypothetical protein QVH35_03780 [Candidatus Nitrosotenuis chungbukensis]
MATKHSQYVPKQGRFLGGSISPAYQSDFDSSIVPIFGHKQKGKHKKDILSGLALIGSSTLYGVAKFVLEKENETFILKRGEDSGKPKHIGQRAKSYQNLVEGRHDANNPTKLKDDYVFLTGIQNGKKYFLTLKGCFVALGFQFNDAEFTIFVKNASKYHLFFAFLQHFLNNEIPIRFVKEIFIKPLHEKLIKNGKFIFDESLSFYFTKIAELYGEEVLRKISDILGNVSPTSKPLEFEIGPLECIPDGKVLTQIYKINKKLYKKNPNENWSTKMMILFGVNIIGTDDDLCMESRLLWLVMRELDQAFSYAL